MIPHNPELVAWAPPKEEPKEPTFEELYEEWCSDVQHLKKVAATNLYDSADPLTIGDLWMHRLLVSQSIVEIQAYILNFFGPNLSVEALDSKLPPEIQKIETQITELVDLLHQWHGSPGAQLDLPEDFCESMEEALSGNVEDFDQGLHARFGGTK